MITTEQEDFAEWCANFTEAELAIWTEEAHKLHLSLFEHWQNGLYGWHLSDDDLGEVVDWKAEGWKPWSELFPDEHTAYDELPAKKDDR